MNSPLNNPLYDQLFGRHTENAAPFLHLTDGACVTYQAFVARAAQFAHVLVAAGAQPGDRVAVQLAKSPDALAVYAACAQAGFVFLPLNTAYTPAEVQYFVQDAQAKVLIASPAKAEALTPVIAQIGGSYLSLDTDNTGSLASQAKTQPKTFTTQARRSDDLAAILYTSGTTGRSKGAMLTQDNLRPNAHSLMDLWQFTDADVLLHALPIYHTHGLFVGTNITLLAGGAMLFLPRIDIDQMITLMPRATTMMGVPTFYTRLLDDPRFDAELTAHMRLFISGSAPMLAATHAEFTARTGQQVLERYGMTETNMSTSNPYAGVRKAGTVGLPLPGVALRICDATGAQVPQGEIGVIEVRGPNVFAGYWQMPEKTKTELRADGFFITGDLAVQDAEGYVTIVGRDKDLIIAGGLNIYPKEIETVLDQIPGVLESAVIGVPHPDLGEAVVAVLAAAPGSVLDQAQIAASLEGQLARFKQPRDYVTVDHLPRNAMGKVQKAALRKTYAGLFTTRA